MALTPAQIANLPTSPNTEIATAGKKVLLYVAQADNDFIVVGGQRNVPLSMTAESLNGSHKASGDWTTAIPGMKSWSISYDGLEIYSDVGVQILEHAFLNDKEVNVKIVYADKSYRTGWCFVTEFSDDNSHTDVNTLSITLTGNGEISERQEETTP